MHNGTLHSSNKVLKFEWCKGKEKNRFYLSSGRNHLHTIRINLEEATWIRNNNNNNNNSNNSTNLDSPRREPRGCAAGGTFR
jgi:hypothetical protein